MTETKRTRSRKPKTAPKADLIELAAEPVTETAENAPVAEPAQALEPLVLAPAVPKGAQDVALSFRDQSEALRQTVRDVVAASAEGALEVNDKIIAALNTQRNAVIDLWRTALDNPPLSGGLNAQPGAAREAFEMASAQWKDVAEATARWMTKSVEPLQSALLRQTR